MTTDSIKVYVLTNFQVIKHDCFICFTSELYISSGWGIKPNKQGAY